MIKAFFRSKKWALWAWGGGLLLTLSLWIQVRITVAINEWYGRFYNLLQQAGDYQNNSAEGIMLFYNHLGGLGYFSGTDNASFLILAMPYVILATATAWFTRQYGLAWREALTFDYIPRWRNVHEDIEGSSQRIQEDCNRFARIVESLGLQVVRAIMTLIAFIPVLWGLSDAVQIPFFSSIPGSLVWTALGVSIGGLIISWFVGWKLPGLEYNNQRVEAAFRKDLVLAEDDKINYAQEETLFGLFTGIKFNYKRLYNHYGYFDMWMGSYDQIMVVVPYLLVGPSLFTQLILLGVVVQVSNAFSKVHSGFALFLHNWTVITELRSIVKRLREFDANLKKYA
jgi:peptide/bleomycin uptake transporter